MAIVLAISFPSPPPFARRICSMYFPYFLHFSSYFPHSPRSFSIFLFVFCTIANSYLTNNIQRIISPDLPQSGVFPLGPFSVSPRPAFVSSRDVVRRRRNEIPRPSIKNGRWFRFFASANIFFPIIIDRSANNRSHVVWIIYDYEPFIFIALALPAARRDARFSRYINRIEY